MATDNSSDLQDEGKPERSFGITFAVVFTLVALYPLLSGQSPRMWWLLIATLFLLISFTRPLWLRPLSRVWNQFGLLLHQIVNPVLMSTIFFVVLTPIALLMRALGKRTLNLKYDHKANSYWVEVDTQPVVENKFKNQF